MYLIEKVCKMYWSFQTITDMTLYCYGFGMQSHIEQAIHSYRSGITITYVYVSL